MEYFVSVVFALYDVVSMIVSGNFFKSKTLNVAPPPSRERSDCGAAKKLMFTRLK
jgi:hypothetical protein